MKNRNIVKILIQVLERNNQDLIFISLSFLKKLSVFGVNKNEMIEFDIVSKIKRFIPCPNPMLTQMALRLLFNLTFDVEI